MTDDRSERLRQRRNQSTSRENVTNSGDGSDTTSEATDAGTDESSVKEEQVGTYMYLPESQSKQLRRLYNILKAEYEFEYGEEFEKNRHFYPLVIQYGLENLDGITAAEINERLAQLNE